MSTPSAENAGEVFGTRMRSMPSSSADRHAWTGPLPPYTINDKLARVGAVTGEDRGVAFAMFAFTIR